MYVKRMILEPMTKLLLSVSCICLLGGCTDKEAGDAVMVPCEEETEDSVYITDYYPVEQGIRDMAVRGDAVYYCTGQGEGYRWTPGAEAELLFTLKEDCAEWSCDKLNVDTGGNLYAICSLTRLDAVEDEKQRYADYLIKFAPEGTELFRRDITPDFPTGAASLAIDAGEHIFIRGENDIRVYDQDGSYVKALSVPDGKRVFDMTMNDRGQVYCSIYGGGGYQRDEIREISFREGISEDAFGHFGIGVGLFAAAGDTFMTSGNGRLYVYDSTDATQQTVLEWMNTGIDPNLVQWLYGTLADGRIVVLLNRSRAGNTEQEFAVLTLADGAAASGITTLTLGTLTASSSLRRLAARYNRQNPTSRIKIKEYYDYTLDSDGSGREQAYTNLNLDIVSGRCPDILNLEYDDLEKYASKGLFADLEPLLKENRLRILPNVKEAYTFNGIVAALPSVIQVRTVAIADKDLPESIRDQAENGWSLDEMLAFMDAHSPDEMFVAEPQDMLEYCMLFNLSQFIDQKKKTCCFDSEEFRRVLEYCGQLPAGRIKLSSNVVALATYSPDSLEQSKLFEVSIRTAEDICLLEQFFKGRSFSFIGFPSSKEAGHMLESADGAYAIAASSRHRQEAEEFMKLLLTNIPDMSSFEALMSGTGFPLEENARKAYYRAALDQPVGAENKNGNRVFNSTLSVYGTTYYFYIPMQEEIDLIEELIGSARIDRNGRGELLSIIQDEAATYFSGQKTAGEAASIIQNRTSLYLREQK